MELFLMQHGECRSESEDPERSLTEAGAEQVRRMAAWAHGAGVSVQQIRHSGKKRAAQTAELLAERLEPTAGVIAVSGLNPNDDVRPVAGLLEGEEKALLIVGHLPSLSRLASQLLFGDPERGAIRFCYAGIVCLTREEGKWSLSWLMPPNLLTPDQVAGRRV
jgi:phosphohistidine phosphatase